MMRLVKSELFKIRTTNTWWIFGIAVVALTGLALLYNCFVADNFLHTEPPQITRRRPRSSPRRTVRRSWSAS